VTDVLGYATTRALRPPLRRARRSYVRDLSRGTLAVLIAVFLHLIASAMAVPIARTGAPAIVAAGWGAPPALVALAGIWMLTRPDPSAPRASRRPRRRLYLRAAAAGVAVLTMAPILFGPHGRAAPVPLALAGVLRWAASTAAVVMLLGLLADLATRLPDPLLARRTRRAVWLIGGVEALGFLGAVATLAAVLAAGRIVPTDLAARYRPAIALPGLIGRLVAGGWWMLLLREYYTQLTRQISFARRHPTTRAFLPRP